MVRKKSTLGSVEGHHKKVRSIHTSKRELLATLPTSRFNSDDFLDHSFLLQKQLISAESFEELFLSLHRASQTDEGFAVFGDFHILGRSKSLQGVAPPLVLAAVAAPLQ